MFVTVSIHSAFDGAQIAHKIAPFYKDLVRTEYHAIAHYCYANAIQSVVVYFNNHKLTFNF